MRMELGHRFQWILGGFLAVWAMGVASRSAAQEVGIGTTAPAVRLDVWAPTDYARGIFQARRGDEVYLVVGKDGNVGVGTASPAARLHVTGDGMVYAEGAVGRGTPMPRGPQTAFIWNPRKAAVRMGRTTGNQWNDEHVGTYSVAAGYNNTASGWAAVVGGGLRNKAEQAQSTVGGGFRNSAGGYSSTVGGGYTNGAVGAYSTVGGGIYDSAAGYAAAVSGGLANIAKGDYSVVAGGARNVAEGDYSFAAGNGLVARSYGEAALGTYNTDYQPVGRSVWHPRDRLLVIGNGRGDNARSDAFVVLKNGNVGIGIGTPAARLHIAGAQVFSTTGAAVGGYAGLYQAEGRLYAFDAQGNVTQISPHNAEGRWHFYSYNHHNGRSLTIEVERLLRAMDHILGGGYVMENGTVLYQGTNQLERLQAENQRLEEKIKKLEAQVGEIDQLRRRLRALERRMAGDAYGGIR